MPTHIIHFSLCEFCLVDCVFQGIPLVVQWLGLCASTAGGLGSILGEGTKILQAAQRGQKRKNSVGI